MGALGSVPIAGADEDFAVALAFPAVKFVYRHGHSLWAIFGKLKGASTDVAGSQWSVAKIFLTTVLR